MVSPALWASFGGQRYPQSFPDETNNFLLGLVFKVRAI